MVRPAASSKSKKGGTDAGHQQPSPPQPQQPKNYNTLAPPLTARSASEQQRQADRAGLLRRLSSGSNSLHRHRSADDHPLLSPYTPVADYKTMAMEMAYLTPRRKVPSVRTTGSPHFRLFSGAGAGASSPVFPPAVTSLGQAAADSPAQPRAPQQPGFFRAGSMGEQENLLGGSPAAGGAAGSPGVLTLALFAASILFLFADQNLLAPNLTVRPPVCGCPSNRSFSTRVLTTIKPTLHPIPRVCRPWRGTLASTTPSATSSWEDRCVVHGPNAAGLGLLPGPSFLKSQSPSLQPPAPCRSPSPSSWWAEWSPWWWARWRT